MRAPKVLEAPSARAFRCATSAVASCRIGSDQIGIVGSGSIRAVAPDRLGNLSPAKAYEQLAPHLTCFEPVPR